MGTVKIQLSDDIEQEFRQKAMQEYGYSKGSLSIAAQTAITAWTTQIKTVKEITAKENPADPVKTIRGMLKHVKKSSLQLQHEIRTLRTEKYVTRH